MILSSVIQESWINTRVLEWENECFRDACQGEKCSVISQDGNFCYVTIIILVTYAVLKLGIEECSMLG